MRDLRFRVKLLNVYRTPKVAESVTPGRVTCVDDVVIRSRDRLTRKVPIAQNQSLHIDQGYQNPAKPRHIANTLQLVRNRSGSC
jgi:hypothetical protein